MLTLIMFSFLNRPANFSLDNIINAYLELFTDYRRLTIQLASLTYVTNLTGYTLKTLSTIKYLQYLKRLLLITYPIFTKQNKI